MKHIKIFEKYKPWKNENIYWEVTLLRPYFNLSLRKIGVPNDLIVDWNEQYVNEDRIVYVYKEEVKNYDSFSDDYDIMTEWRLQPDKDDRDKYVFGGRIRLQEFEIDANKFNL